MRELIIGPNEAGQRLDKLLRKYLNNANDGFIYKMLRKKNITLNDSKANGRELLKNDDHVKLWFSEAVFEKFCSEVNSSIDDSGATLYTSDIVYEDDNILLYNKPAGVLSQKAKPNDVSAVEMLIGYLNKSGKLDNEEYKTFKPSFCNRIDRYTTGLLIAGLSLPGLQQASLVLHDRTIKKEYLCIVKGVIKESLRINGFLTKDEKANMVTITPTSIGDSKPISTEYTPLYNDGEVTLLLVHLITGRTHQIRAHLASIKHPIIGDPKYGDKTLNAMFRDKYNITFQMLHSYRITWPEMDKPLNNLSGQSFTAPVPDTFKKVLKGYTWELGRQEV